MMRIYGWLIASLAVCNAALAFIPIDYKTSGQRLMLQWWFLAGIALYGALGVLLVPRTGFAGIATTRRGAVIAAGHGALLGIATILSADPIEHHPLPEALLVYWYGGAASEIVFHLLPVPLFVFLGSGLLLRGKHQRTVFWIALIVLSAWEGRRSFSIVTYAANASEIWLFRRHGFMAAIAQRMTIYALWHIAWPLIRA